MKSETLNALIQNEKATYTKERFCMKIRPLEAKELIKWQLGKKDERHMCMCGCAKFALIKSDKSDRGVGLIFICLNCGSKFY